MCIPICFECYFCKLLNSHMPQSYSFLLKPRREIEFIYEKILVVLLGGSMLSSLLRKRLTCTKKTPQQGFCRQESHNKYPAPHRAEFVYVNKSKSKASLYEDEAKIMQGESRMPNLFERFAEPPLILCKDNAR